MADAPGLGAGRSVVEAADAHTEEHIDMSTDAGTEGATDNVIEAIEDAATWADRLWQRDNPRGLVRERWWHAHGCRLWLTVERDTVTHEIRSARGPHA